VISNLARRGRIVHQGPFEHASSLKLIETTFGLHPLTARDKHALNLGRVLDGKPHRPIPAGAIPTSKRVPGPKNDASAVCSAKSVQSVSPPPVHEGPAPTHPQPLYRSGWPTGSGMAGLGKELRKTD
jgi:phospholipase C